MAFLLHTGHFHRPRSTFSFRYDSKSKQWICLQSCPRAGRAILLNVIGHFNETLIAVCSTPSSPFIIAWPVIWKCLLTETEKTWNKKSKNCLREALVKFFLASSSCRGSLCVKQITMLKLGFFQLAKTSSKWKIPWKKKDEYWSPLLTLCNAMLGRKKSFL